MPQLHAILTQPYPLGFLLTGAGTTPKRSRPMVLRLLQRRVCSTAFPPFANIRELQLALHTLVLPCRLHDTSFVACQHGPVGSGTTTVTGIGGAPDAHDFIVQSLGRKTTRWLTLDNRKRLASTNKKRAWHSQNSPIQNSPILWKTDSHMQRIAIGFSDPQFKRSA